MYFVIHTIQLDVFPCPFPSNKYVCFLLLSLLSYWYSVHVYPYVAKNGKIAHVDCKLVSFDHIVSISYFTQKLHHHLNQLPLIYQNNELN